MTRILGGFAALLGIMISLAGAAKAQTAAAEPAVSNAPQDDTKGPSTKEWVRVQQNDSGEPVAMQVAIVRYEGTPPGARRPVTVDLIGAVHVGDAAYYRRLDRRFRQYDALLYELVAPQGTIIPRDQKASTRNPLGAIQGGMKSMLELEHQLERVDYTQPNFVHADMSPDELFAKMDERGEGLVQMYFRLLGQGIAMQSEQTAKGESFDADLIGALFARDRARKLKIAMAKQMTQMDVFLSAFDGEDGSTLITERNIVALKVLSREIEGGKRKLGVFYGAGHLNDMDERLRTDFGMEPTKQWWLNAWDLRPKSQRRRGR
ncbi:hypothetical protein Mal64_29730 [Pseudobythopirellula maris]|uniref:TraB family protein n=1 Tax=Pseudobythopirellula maris TaxID=2527991 RepID=A0A5C5ZJ86_9BACT|nr:hypothetical protein [Pseudobythopirellula maris]TWT87434.1 hypothetical protein Mal64_29730 [Pseudobythopirellula maris]